MAVGDAVLRVAPAELGEGRRERLRTIEPLHQPGQRTDQLTALSGEVGGREERLHGGIDREQPVVEQARRLLRDRHHLAPGLLHQGRLFRRHSSAPGLGLLDLNLLAVLDALIEERSVTRAASRLNFAQPTVSGALARLRVLFGDPLFVRTQRGLLPTKRAEALAVPLKQLLADGQRLVAREAFDPANAETTVVVSTNELHAARPGGAVRAAAAARGPTDTPRHRAADHRRPRRSAGARRGRPCDHHSRVGLRRQVRYSVPSFLLVPELLQTDDLVAVVPSRLLRDGDRRLAVLKPPVEVAGFDVIAVWHPRVDKDVAHRWLRTRLAETARRP